MGKKQCPASLGSGLSIAMKLFFCLCSHHRRRESTRFCRYWWDAVLISEEKG